jgi:coenzyme F420-reducing hydrogenase alpha subunit
MSLPLKDFRPGISEHTHRVLTRIARARGISLQELGREIIEAYVAKAIHDAKVVLGQDDDYARSLESAGRALEDAGASRNASARGRR